MKTIPSINQYMSAAPHTIGVDQSLAKASKMMTDYKIRHLPVLNGGQLVGVVSERDIKFLESFKDVDPEKVKIEDAYSEDAYIVSPKAPLGEVCAEMALHKYGSVLVVDNNRLVGIFTWVDALHAFNNILQLRN
ncbi:Hypoxic response protein 1 [compost metagenome]